MMSDIWQPSLPARAVPAPILHSALSVPGLCHYDPCEARGDPLTGHIVTATLGPLVICNIKARAHIKQHLYHFDSYAAAPFIKIVFQRRGVAYLQQGDRRTIINEGRWSVYDASRPYAVQNVEDLEQFAILIPRDIKSPEIEQGINLAPEASMAMRGISRVLFSAAVSALDVADDMDEAMREALGHSIMDLAKLALVDRLGGAARISMRETFREKVKRYVQHNLADSELSVASIAEALQCSKRYLHKGFAESGETLSQFIWSVRLEKARRDLASETLANRSITEIAFNWGFVNSAHFSRRFHNRYGLSPREYRKLTLGRTALAE